ncbi:type II toxin-antitoxin system PemK/MazF family toxin [Desulfonatronospira thiodismutans]|uniref:type II toxin-antitoxin system PemK/MazF family toxin n=1 Tax=Desulfonatronospira thiodismutans TaxID=488939 RepID=UPI000680F4A9
MLLFVTAYLGLSTQVPAGIDNGLKYDCSIHCDELVSIPKSMLSDFIGTLRPAQMNKLDQALSIALGLDKFPA